MLTAEVHDLALLPGLIELLDDGDPRVQRAATKALETMAHLPSLGDAQAWNAWFSGEHGWWESEGERLCGELTSPRAGEASEALRVLSQHPLYRHEAAQRISDSLTKQSRSTSLSACSVLATLGSRAALPGLVRALEEGHAQLRSSAWQTLRALTGKELRLDGRTWREAVGE